MEKNTVQLAGFNAVERMDATVTLNKLLDKLKRHFGEFDEFSVVKKEVHAQKGHAAIEINANLVVGGKRFHGHAEGFTLKEVLDGAFYSIESAAIHKD